MTLARLDEGLELVGAYGLIAAVLAIVRPLAELGLRPTLATEFAVARNIISYIAVRALGIALICSVGLVASVHLGRDGLEQAFLAAVVLLRASDSASDFCYGIMQRASHARWQGVSQVLKGTGITALLLLSLAFNSTGTTTMVLMAACSLAWVVSYDLRRARDCMSVIRREEEGHGTDLGSVRSYSVVGLLVLSWPMGIAALANGVTQALPRLMLGAYFDRATVGIWTAVYSLGQMVGLANQAFLAAEVGRLGEQYRKMRRVDYWRILRARVVMVMASILLIVPVIYVCAPTLMRILYGSEFVVGGMVVTYVIGARVFDAARAYLKVTQIIRRKMMTQAVSAVGLVLASLLMAYVFIPKWGIYGAALMTITLSAGSFLAAISVVRYGLLHGRPS
jgi:O-antigen/teichoic acid export membrane protein